MMNNNPSYIYVQPVIQQPMLQPVVQPAYNTQSQLTPVFIQQPYNPAYNPYLMQSSAPPPLYDTQPGLQQTFDNSTYNNNTNTISTEKPNISVYPYWKTGLCDCCSDCGICLLGCFALPCLYGRNNSKLDGSNCFCSCLSYVLCCGPIQHCCFRSKIRNLYGIKGSSCNDICATFICCFCAVCQEAREITIRNTSPTQQTMI
jgi:Cys-rich protein (TIGR01571 family)